jgi:hypothetical protein
LLTLPEFIREAVPHTLQSQPDPNALLTLDEAAREHPSPPLTPGPHPFQRSQSSKGTRNRSMSAPPLSWLLPASSKSVSGENAVRSVKESSSQRPSSVGKGGAFVFPLSPATVLLGLCCLSTYRTASVVCSRAP